MNGLQKAGGCMTLLAMPFFCLAVFMVIDPKEGATTAKSLAPGMFFGSALLLPGVFMWFAGQRVRRERDFLEGLTGMVRSHDRFRVAEMATKIGRTELETEALIARIIAADNGIDLVFHRSTREYLHRARLGAGERIVERCSSCGAPTRGEVVFAGETVPCAYCGAPLVRPS